MRSVNVEGGVVTEKVATQFLGFREKFYLPLPSTELSTCFAKEGFEAYGRNSPFEKGDKRGIWVRF